ncbi:HNH endonuclease [Actinomyces sp. 594]|uniref:HNH endonuclease signature motif containing protein n=1 Tax=Actinomyces sp. 594 TaxID=2057793 RepID=UPI00280ADC0D|nr:HNH endonuclease [Actinomyces sp. 594]
MDSEAEGLVERLSGVPAGADLADLIEGLLSVLLVPAHPGATTDDADGAADANEVLSIPDTDAVLAAVTSPAERTLAEAAGRLGMDWGQGTGADALACLGGQVLSELVGACHRLGAWAAWAEGVAAACLTRTAEMNRGIPPWGPGGELECPVTEDERRFTASGEISARLGTTRSSAGLLLDRGQAMLQPEFAATEALHRAGMLDTSKTALIIRRLQGVSPDTAAAVQERVLARAPRRTCSQLGRDIDKALASLDPKGISGRRRRDEAGWRVTRPRPAGEGTHEMRLLLPSLDALLLDATLDAIAASARAGGDRRTLSQLRADAITGMTLRTLQGSQNLACRTANTSNAGTSTSGDVGVDVNGANGDSVKDKGASSYGAKHSCTSGYGAKHGCTCGDGTGDDAHGDPQTPTVAGAAVPALLTAAVGGSDPALGGVEQGAAGLLPDGVPLPGLLGALSSLVEPSRPWWTPSGLRPVFPPPGITINVDVTVPLNLILPDGGGESPPADSRSSLPASGRREVTAGGGKADPETAVGSSLPATGGGSALSGRSTGTLPGSGVSGVSESAEVVVGAGRMAVPAATARALAAGGTWRRLVTDPLSGAVLDVGRTHYRPPVGLRDLVQARDQECVFPGCATPAARCDIDHVVPWAAGGATSLNNLAALCQAHHRLKHAPGWTLTRQHTDEGDAALIWTTPTGARYRRTPDGTITLLPRRIGPRQLAMPAQRVPQHLADAVDGAVVSRLEHGLDLAAQAQQNDPADGFAAATAAAPATDAASPARPSRPPEIVSRGPRPGHPTGAFETKPFPYALHELGLAPLLDQIPPF